MKAGIWCWWSLTISAATLMAASFSSDVPEGARRGAYLGLPPPGTTPRVFAPGIVSMAGRDEVSSTITPDGKELYFAIFEPGRGYTLRFMVELESGWTAEGPAPFASDFSEVDPFITGDGQRCFFISKRPFTAGMERSPTYQIWVVHREGTGWGSLQPLSPTVNTKDRQLFPTVSDDGTLFFGSDRPGGLGGSDIYSAGPEDAGFAQPVNLGAAINTAGDETDALIAPDGSFLVFTAADRADGLGGGDFYISYRDSEGGWGPARNVGAEINSPHSDFCPTLSPDGRYFFFTSNRNGSNDIFWVDAEVIHSNREAGEGMKGKS